MDILNLKSNLRRKILALFFTNPDKQYYVRQLERLTGYSAGNISNELKRLNRDRLFETEKMGNILFYRLNRRHPIYSELRSIIAKTLERLLGAKCWQAENGEKALTMYKSKNIDLVITDYNMPGISGLALLDQLLGYDPKACVIVATGKPDEKLKKQAVSKGARQFIHKPYDIKSLADSVKRLWNEFVEKEKGKNNE